MKLFQRQGADGAGPRRPGIVLIGSASEISHTLGEPLQASGYRVARFLNAASFFAAGSRFYPQCIVVDIDPKHLTPGLISMECLIEGPWRYPTVVLNARSELPPAIGRMLLRNFVFLQRPVTPQVLLEAVRHCAHMRPYRRINGVPSTLNQLIRGLASLTARELTIAGDMLAGRSCKAIASQYDISPKTVEQHRSHILCKLGVGSAFELLGLYWHSAGS